MIAVHSVPDTFSPGECARLLSQVADRPAQDARLVGRERDHNIRRADLVWLDEVPQTDWVMDRMIALVRESNREIFDFDVTEFGESPQVARYDAAREGHFDWHADIGDGRLAARRKLTIVVQLSEPGSYDGGGLEIRPGTHSVEADRAQGAATVFPAFALHRVTPVRRGTRHSLTVWCHGPAFR